MEPYKDHYEDPYRASQAKVIPIWRPCTWDSFVKRARDKHAQETIKRIVGLAAARNMWPSEKGLKGLGTENGQNKDLLIHRMFGVIVDGF